MRVPAWVMSGVIAFSAAAVSARDKDPRVPPGHDPGGPAVGLISTGVNYTLPAIAARLARDGEGEVIGWDFADGDRMPFDAGERRSPEQSADGTVLAGLIASQASAVRLVPVRVAPQEPAQAARALAFLAQTPARAVVLAVSSPRREHWEPFRLAAQHFRRLLIIVPVVADGAEAASPLYPAALGLDNVLRVDTPAEAPPEAGTAAAAVLAVRAAEKFALTPELDGAAVRQALQPR